MKKIIIILLLCFAIFSSISTAGIISCEDKPGYFQDEFGDIYCSNENLDFFTIENNICLLNMEGFLK